MKEQNLTGNAMAGASEELTLNQQMERYVDTLFGVRRGTAALVVGRDPFLTSSGSYDHRDWQPKFFLMPEQREELLSLARRCRRSADVYVCPLLRTSEARTKQNSQAGCFLWSDIDRPYPDALDDAVARFGDGYLISVQSGHGLHLYVGLSVDVQPDDLELLNFRMKEAVGGDHKWTRESLLRLPGTFNHKPTVHGGQALPVIAHFSTGKPWDRALLDQLLPDVAPTPRTARGSVRSAAATSNLQGLLRGLPPFVQDALEEEARPGSRSEQSYRFVSWCVGAGYDLGDTITLAALHPPTMDKYDDRLPEEVARSYEALRATHDHEGERCSFAGCADAVVAEVLDTLALLGEGHWQLPGTSRQQNSTDAVFRVVLDTAQRCKSMEFDLAEREAGERAGVSRGTAGSALKRLVDGEVLSLVSSGGHLAATYRLHPSALVGPHFSQGGFPTTDGLVALVHPGHDLWTYRGLGPSARRIYEAALRLGPCTAPKLAEQVGLGQRTVEKHLEALGQAGLVHLEDEDLFVAETATEQVLDELAAEAGASGTIAKRIAFHARQREGFHRYLAHMEEGAWDGTWQGLQIKRLIPPRRAETDPHNSQVARKHVVRGL